MMVIVQRWNLNVNTAKSENYNNGIWKRQTCQWNIQLRKQHNELEIVGSFNYCNWQRTHHCIHEYGSYALHNLYRTVSNVDLHVVDKINMCDYLVGSVLSWERLHTRLCRLIRDGLIHSVYAMLRDDVNQGNSYNGSSWASHVTVSNLFIHLHHLEKRSMNVNFKR